jgi:hypothetical protein
MRKTAEALRWIIGILNSKEIQFQVTGGFAARSYGSNRELADIDIDINDKDFDKIINDVKQYIVFGPEQYTDDNWNLKLITLDYGGQIIDIGGEPMVFDKGKKEWILVKTDFSNSTHMNIYGIDIPVIKKESLVEYKRKLLREVDVEDIRGLTQI